MITLGLQSAKSLLSSGVRYIGLRADNDRRELPRGHRRDEKLRYILKDNRDAVAAANATFPEPTREPVAEAIQLSIG